ncbi:hypothetical protein ACWC4D_26985 [Streptomyces sp. NPDC001288]|uniref:hypothetical protein n=1 Tax=unclassified Streptomyces TaxID=2593676 RepID=UPI00332A08FB
MLRAAPAAQYPHREHSWRSRRLPARKHGNGTFVLLLRVVNSQAYGPDVVELVEDVTRAAQAPLPPAATAPSPAPHRAP